MSIYHTGNYRIPRTLANRTGDNITTSIECHRGKEIETTSRITGSGAFGVDEFIGKERNPELDDRYCVFTLITNK